jgi:hypothetical protein
MKNLYHKIILFLDNATCHPDIKLTNTQLSFLPPNTNSVCQPLDFGVTKAFKAQYRNKLLRHILANLDNASSLSELKKSHCTLCRVIDYFSPKCDWASCSNQMFLESWLRDGIDAWWRCRHYLLEQSYQSSYKWRNSQSVHFFWRSCWNIKYWNILQE